DRARYRSTGDGAPPVIELLGRASACINTGGEKVFAEEVEERLRDHPAIADLVVAPAADDRFGQLVAAVASLNPGASLTLDELRSFGRGLLADYKLPRRLLLVETVVRSPSGKPDYPWARQQLEGPATVRSSP
ncbi:MAG: acyl-CoA synthetase, partial [Microthrixaceae bacterium]|nr:acyl-CoA synthetase [Microthrixaceae bacterium]